MITTSSSLILSSRSLKASSASISSSSTSRLCTDCRGQTIITITMTITIINRGQTIITITMTITIINRLQRSDNNNNNNDNYNNKQTAEVVFQEKSDVITILLDAKVTGQLQ